MFFRTKKVKNYEYLQIVENYRERGGKTRQRVLVTLGNMKELREKGRFEVLLESGARLSEKIALLNMYKSGSVKKVMCKRTGADLIFGRLWKELGIGEILREHVECRRYRFDVERAIYHTVLHRLFESGSDRSSLVWSRAFNITGTEGLDLHHLYRAMGFLGRAVEDERGGSSLTLRCKKDEIEEGLFFRRRDLFTDLELVFFDTTSIYFEGEGGGVLREYGHSKDHRPDRKQIVVGVVTDNAGIPLCCEMWPGNTADVKTLKEVVKRLQKRFGIKGICIVADRGMISSEVIDFLEGEESSFSYILGVRLRKEKRVRTEVLSRGGRYHVVNDAGSDGSEKKSPLQVKEVIHEGRRYIVCLNKSQAEKDKLEREAVIESLCKKLKNGDKSLIGNKGYRKYVKSIGKEHFAIDTEKIKEEARYDGKWVLTTNCNDMPAEDVAKKYKMLWMVENVFRTMKSILDTRPVYHKMDDDTIRGHVFCSFLALLLRRELERRLNMHGFSFEWNDIIHDIGNIEEVTAEISGKKVIFRSQLQGCAGKVFQSVGVAVPPTVRPA